MNKEKLGAAIKSLKAILMECHPKPKPTKIDIQTYPRHGLRVGEISFIWKPAPGGGTMAGASYMRSETPKIILAAEEFLITFGIKPNTPAGWTSAIDVHEEAASSVRAIMEEESR